MCMMRCQRLLEMCFDIYFSREHTRQIYISSEKALPQHHYIKRFSNAREYVMEALRLCLRFLS
jgi:uncharacterized membrane protein YecN with MAPEG domain